MNTITAGFKPKNMVVKTQSGKMRKVSYIDVRGYWPDGSIGIDQYYDANFAVFQRVSIDDLLKINGYTVNTPIEALQLYNKLYR